MRGFKIILFSSVIFLALTTASVFSYDNITIHPRLTEAAVNLFEQSGQKLTSEQKNLIIQGSVEEDVAPRYLNHFYDPTTGKGLTGFFSGESAKQWAQKQDSVTGDYSETAILDNYRRGNLIVAYKGIGHILHLIQDMAVPAHVRNDPHADGDPYEKWAKQNGVIGQNFKNIPISNLNSVFDSLASFTHHNFFSKDSMNSSIESKITHAKVENDAKGEKTTYGYYNNYKLIKIIKYSDHKKYELDAFIHQDYWSQLHPQAVGFTVGWSGNDSSPASTTSGLAGFDVEYRIGTDDWQGWMDNASSVTAVFDLPVQNKTDVYFRIRVRDQAGNLSIWSDEVKTRLDDGIADHIVINEIKITGETATDEFVELYNPTEMAISLAGYQLKRKSSTGVEYNLLSDFGAEEVPAKGHFLITHPTGYAGSTTADLVYSGVSYSLAANNTVILYNGTTTVDKLGFGGAADAETAAFLNNPDSGQSLERKINGYDSDDNGADFIIRDVPTPQNSGVDRTPIAEAEIPDITVDSISSGFNTKYLKTFSLPHTIAGQDPLLVVNIHSDGDYITSITYDNLPLTLAVKSTSKQAYNNMFSAIYYLTDPPPGQHNIIVDRAGNAYTSKAPLSVAAISLNNCDQINPIAAVNSGLVGGPHISLPIQVSSAKAMLIDSVTFNYGLNLTEDSGQISAYELPPFWGQTNYLAFGDSYKTISTPGDYEMGWSVTGQYGAAYTVMLVKGGGD